MTRLALIFDDQARPHWRAGNPPRTALSHDTNLFQLGHEALRVGMTLHFTIISEYHRLGEAWPVSQVYPALELSEDGTGLAALDPDILVCVHPQVFAAGQLPRAKKVGLHAALYFLEMPQTYDDAQTLALLQAVRWHVDHLVVQNERMREMADALYTWLCRWRTPDRIHVAPLGIVAEQRIERRDRDASRRMLGLQPTDIAIVNAGGAWRWTALNDFLRGFCAAIRSGAANLHLFLSGFRQAGNTDHGEYIAETLGILRQNIDLIGRADARDFVRRSTAAGSERDALDPGRGHIHFRPDWAAAGRELPELLSAGDFGLNVSADSVENWQSHRVRCLDYIRYGLPVIGTTGDLLGERDAREVTLRVAERSPEAFEALLHRIAAGEVKASAMHPHFKSIQARLDTRDSFGRLLTQIDAMPRRTVDGSDESVLEYAWRMRRSAGAEAVLRNLTEAAFKAGS